MPRRRTSASDHASSPRYEYAPDSAYLGPGEERGRDSLLPGAHEPFTEEYTLRPPPPSNGRFPKLIWGRSRPGLKLKLRKQFHPLSVTRLTLGMDLDLCTAEVGFKWSWTDRIIGGRLAVDRHTVSLTKRFHVQEMRANLDVRAALDLKSRKTLFSLAVQPFAGVVSTSPRMNGIAIRKRIPVDKRVDVEVFGRLQLPEAKFSTENNSPFSMGEGDFVVHLDQLNFRFLLQ